MAAGRSRSEQGVRNTQAAFLADADPDFPIDSGQQRNIRHIEPWKLTQQRQPMPSHRRLGGGR